MKLPNGMFLIDIRTRIDKSVINMLLIIMNSDQIYSIESWELKIEEIFPGYLFYFKIVFFQNYFSFHSYLL